MRAAFNEDGLYCLAFAERLDYEAGEKLFEFIQTMINEGNVFLFTDFRKSNFNIPI